MDPLLTLKEFAGLVKRTEKAVYGMVARGQIRPVRLGRSLRFRPVDVQRILKHGHSSRPRNNGEGEAA